MFSRKPLLKNVRTSSRRRNALRMELLEDRRLMTVSVSLDAAGLLSIRGDNTADNVTVYQSGITTFVQSTNSAGATIVNSMGTTVKSLDIRSYGGDDVVNNNTNLRAGIWGGDGNDTLNGGSNVDVIYGEADSDTINGNASRDYLFGGTGYDVIRGGAGNDYIEGDDFTTNNLSVAAEQALPYTNNDVIYGGAGQDEIYGQLGRDWIYGGGSGDKIDGGRGNDVLYGDDGLSSSYVSEDAAYAGADTIRGGDGNDFLYGGYGADTLYGGNGDDVISGGEDNDRLYGNAGADYVAGEGGDDFLDAGSAAETSVYGGDGNDFNAYVTAVNEAKFNDISQGNTGNCFVLSSMGTAAMRGVDMASRITYTGKGYYSVALFKPNSMGGYSPTTVNVYFDGTLRTTDPAAHFRGQEGESWTVIMSRALAQLLNLDLTTLTGGYAGNPLSAITGRAPNTTSWSDSSGFTASIINDSRLQLLYAVGNQVPTVVATTGAGALDTSLFVPKHVYMVQGVYITGYVFNWSTYQNVPQYTVVLYNPHGVDNREAGKTAGARSSGDNSDGLITITGAEFLRSFGEITFA